MDLDHAVSPDVSHSPVASNPIDRPPRTFIQAKNAFDNGPGKAAVLANSLVPVDGKPRSDLVLRAADGSRNEEYYKWQFLHALINSGLVPKDHIGAEVRFPKGSRGSNPLRLDAAVFDTPEWLDKYQAFWADRKPVDLEWLNDHLVAVVEFKKNDKESEKVFAGQVKPAMKEKEPSTAYVLGIYYAEERLTLFHRRDGLYLRYDESKNQKGDDSKVGDMSLELTDPYSYIPCLSDLLAKSGGAGLPDRSARSIDDLDTITTIAAVHMKSALSDVLRALDKGGLVNQRGYEVIIQTFALKIFDEKRNERYPSQKLEFYVTDDERGFASLTEGAIQGFISRMEGMWSEARAQYQRILGDARIDWRNASHVRAVVAVCHAFQDFAFVRSAKSDLYQLVFYNFANQFKRGEAGQFLTPLPVIDFLVELANPRDGETVFDPCCGIGDFLSLAFVNGQLKEPAWQLDDANIYGVDLDENMIMLATLNMLLNGDGEAKLFQQPDKGSIEYKVAAKNPPSWLL